MSHIHHQQPISPAMLTSALFLVGLTLATVTAARIGLITPPPSPAAERGIEHVAPVQIRDLRFTDLPGGALSIVDVKDGRTAQLIKPGEPSGFIRGVLRGLMRDRKLRGLTAAPPLRLTLWKNGALSLDDPATGRSVELGSFGADNRAAFARLLRNQA